VGWLTVACESFGVVLASALSHNVTRCVVTIPGWEVLFAFPPHYAPFDFHYAFAGHTGDGCGYRAVTAGGNVIAEVENFESG